MIQPFLLISMTGNRRNLSPLEGKLMTRGDRLFLPKGELYHWTITALYQPLCKWLAAWLTHLPEAIELRDALLPLEAIEIYLPATNYKKLFKAKSAIAKNFTLSFTSPTGFRLFDLRNPHQSQLFAF
jgi:hypothetical protein